MNHRYRFKRVIPRDLFNEAKLLKCLGQLALVLHDGKDAVGRSLPPGWKIEFIEPEYADGFRVVQNPADGGLSCAAVRALFRGRPVRLWTVYNCRDPYPLCFDVAGEKEWTDGRVFNDNGHLHLDILTLDPK